MNDRELASVVVEALTEGIVPWRFPINIMPEFKALFGRFFVGEPKAEAEVDYRGVDAIIEATGAKVVHHWRVVKPRFQRPPHERILLPPKSRFFSERTYHATRIHEALHYVEHRVGWIGSDHQAELVAEVGTAFIESYLGLPHDSSQSNNAKWLPKWEEGIRADSAYLFDAVAQAERAADYLLDLCRRKEAA